MQQQIVESQKLYWNEHFANENGLAPTNAEWIEELLGQTSRRLAGRVLEIGGGRGYDTRYLVETGCQVTTLDLSWTAL